MGCYIEAHAERKEKHQWIRVQLDNFFPDQHYGLFGWLAGVRNYSGVHPIASPRGLPLDVSNVVRERYSFWSFDAHTPTWLSVLELLVVDYDKTIEDRRITKQVGRNWFDGGCTAPIGEGKNLSLREFLGSEFFDGLALLQRVDAHRVVFWFSG